MSPSEQALLELEQSFKVMADSNSNPDQMAVMKLAAKTVKDKMVEIGMMEG